VNVFNPLPITRGELQKIKVYTNNITLVRIDKDFQLSGKQPRFTLVKTHDSTGASNDPSQYDLYFTIEL
jgi:hypothetical protein